MEAIPLAFDDHGSPEAPPVVVAHGLFGSRSNWRPIARQLQEDHRILLVDLRNHGASPWSEEMDYPAMAADLGRFVEEHCGGRATLLGHSMGGKAAMWLALHEPEMVERLVLVDIAPVAYGGVRHLALVEAMLAVDLSQVKRRDDADAMLREQGIESLAIRQFLLQNLVRDKQADGYRWRLHLEVLGREFDTIRGWPGHEGLRFKAPTLIVRGSESDYVDEEGVQAALDVFEEPEVSTIDGAGHWLHAEQPAGFLRLVKDFLKS